MCIVQQRARLSATGYTKAQPFGTDTGKKATEKKLLHNCSCTCFPYCHTRLQHMLAARVRCSRNIFCGSSLLLVVLALVESCILGAPELWRWHRLQSPNRQAKKNGVAAQLTFTWARKYSLRTVQNGTADVKRTSIIQSGQKQCISHPKRVMWCNTLKELLCA